ncbi:MAG: spermidine/putrescine ABC transporter [Chloroflexi bacterium HGW-Chloroflexi-10]|nr:MAG: spermidine/putrescine ABC transporter [Chloroflexi bacterium HGW-Chloroflexi-10]
MERKFSFLGSFYYVLMVLFMYLPILVLIVFSFNDSVILAFPLKGFTFKWYEQLAGAHELLMAARNSVVVGVVSSLVATVIGAMAAVAITKHHMPARNLFLGLSSIPMVMPSIVLGVAMLVLFRRVFNLDLNLWLISAAHVLISIPTTILMVIARLADFSQNLEEAAMDLGANYWVTLMKVTLPISLPALVASFLTAFTTSFDEYAMTTLITGTETTLPVYLYSLLRFPRRLPVAVAMGSIIMVVSAALVLLAEWLRRYGTSRPKNEEVL